MPHPSLNLSNVNNLALSFQRRARAAASGDSPNDTLELVNGLYGMAKKDLPFLVPVFYATLNPSGIPRLLAQVNAQTHVNNFASQSILQLYVVQALFSLRGISFLALRDMIATEALPDLWDRVVPWMQFLDEYREHLTGVEKLPQDVRYSLWLYLIRFFRKHEAIDKSIDSSFGLCVVVGRAWGHILAAKDKVEVIEEGLRDISQLVGFWFRKKTWNAAAFDELLVGAGGSRTQLASLVIDHLQYIVPSPETDITQDKILKLVGVVSFVVASINIRGQHDTAFRDALFSQGLVAMLTTLIIGLCFSTQPIADIQLKSVLGAVTDYLSADPSPRRIIECGSLFPAMIVCAEARLIPVTREYLVELLQHVLPSSTIYASVLGWLSAALYEIDENLTFNTDDTEVHELWKSFRALAEDRIQTMHKSCYNPEFGSIKAERTCDNLECNKLFQKADLKRCSACLSVLYCSQTCQLADWLSGHRWGCAYVSTRRDEQSHLTTRDRSFLRVLTHHDYLLHREQIAAETALFIQNNPTRSPRMYVLFDYTQGACRVEVKPLEALDVFDPKLRGLRYDAERAASNPRKVQLHLMKIASGRNGVDLGEAKKERSSRIWAFPLRCIAIESVGASAGASNSNYMAGEVIDSADDLMNFDGRMVH
ncbi:hypothetical protein R3P38DRAFT_3132859 [Favolaschia claudopus]|uniref:MYND-type domain-containing protein n=1 Tax=Favolaschia claudopus TaxID=2862362 RepID=A0AAV9Z912_9AGAR